MRDLGSSKGARPGIADADLLEELESSRRRVRELERNLAERELQEAAGRKEVARLAEAFKPARIRAWCWTVATRQTQYLPIHGDVRDSQGRHASQVSLSEEKLLQSIHPDDRERLASTWDRAYAEHVPYEIEYRLVLTGGEVRHNHEIARPEFDGSGRYLGHFGTTQDITDRVQAEEALREARDELELRVAERTRDIEEKNETLKREITEREWAETALRKNELFLQDRIELLEETERKLEWQGEDLVRLADDLLTARDEARTADRVKSEFLAAMSHELRTPLNAIIGFSEIMKNETLGPVGGVQYRDYAEDINESGHHLLALINDILDLSKIESGADELYEENIEILELANTIIKLVVGLAHAGNVELELDVSDDIAMLHADERRVKQILLNLLSNAIKFTPGGGKITLKIWLRAESGYVFQVIDTGIGIAFEDISKALAPFQQIDSGLNRKHEGTGLGLPLTKSLVEMHGGYLDLQSEVGVGTTVTVRFPAERIVRSPPDTKTVNTADRKAG